MGFNIEMKNHLEYKDGTGTTIYFVGEKVICETGEKQYMGKIAAIGYYQREGDSEPKPAICIDVPTKPEHSSEVIMVGDITYLYNDSFSYRAEVYKDLLDVVMRNKNNMEKQDQDKVGKILMGLYQLSGQE